MTKKSGKAGLKIGLAAAGLATAAGIYFLYGSENAAKNRKKVKGWAIKAKGEAIELIEKAKSIDSETYQAIIDQVITKAGGSSRDKVELKRELLSYWNKIKMHIGMNKGSSQGMKSKSKKSSSKRSGARGGKSKSKKRSSK